MMTSRQRIFSTSLPKGRGDLIEHPVIGDVAKEIPKEEEGAGGIVGQFFKMIQKKLTLNLNDEEEQKEVVI